MVDMMQRRYRSSFLVESYGVSVQNFEPIFAAAGRREASYLPERLSAGKPWLGRVLLRCTEWV